LVFIRLHASNNAMSNLGRNAVALSMYLSGISNDAPPAGYLNIPAAPFPVMNH